MMMKGLLSGVGALLFASAAFAADPGVTDTEIKIGDVSPLSGVLASAGRAISAGTKVAAAEINAAGGVNGRKIVIVTEDDGYVPARAFQALKKMIELDKIFALNASSGTASTLAMMPLITENNLPIIVTTNQSEALYNPVRPSVFALGARYSDAFYAQLKYIHDKVAPKDAVYGLVRQDDDFGATMEAGYERAIKEFNLKDGIRIKYKRGQTNFEAEALQLRQAGVTVLANGAFIAGAANLLSETRKLGMDLQVASVWTEGMPSSVKLLAPSGYPYFVADYTALGDAATDKFDETAKKYLTPEEMQGVNRFSYVTYISLKSLAKAMANCGKDLTRECTIAELRKVKNADTGGLTGPLSFDNKLQLSGTSLKVYRFKPKENAFETLTDFVQY